MKAAGCCILVFFSWSHSNIGDIGITPGLLRLLQTHVPQAEVIVVANTKADETREYLQKRFPKCEVVGTPFRARKISPEFRKAFDRADLVLYNSGTTLSYGRWEYDWKPEPGSPEEMLFTDYLRPRDWLGEDSV